jgi:molybdopterin-guanine dinucleotide biosynthesis protein A
MAKLSLPVSHAAIIAGGASRRMGTNKALLPFEGEALIARIARVLRPLFAEVLVVTADEQLARAANLFATPDIFPAKGPLGGVHAALKYCGAPTFCVACDLPFLNPEIIRFLCEQFVDCQVLAPRIAGHMEPLHAIYAPSILPILESVLAKESVPRVERSLAATRVKFIGENELKVFDADLKFLTNLNTPQDAHNAGFSL